MSLPEWGNSYNALCVPLKNGWQCALVPVRDIEDVDPGWRLSYEERQKARKEREEQMEQDRQDFDQLFRVSIRHKAARISAVYSAYASFVREHIRGGWHTPVDGEDVTRLLRQAVRDGLIVPAIDRNWRGSVGVSKRYAPQTWPTRAPDPKPIIYGIRNGQFVPLDEGGRFIDHTPYAPVVDVTAASVGQTAASSDLADWLGKIGDAAEALNGRGGASDNGDDGEAFNAPFSDYPSGASTRLGYARAFDYTSSAPGGDVASLAANVRGSMYACDILSSECKDSVLREFPGQYLNSTLNDIQSDAQDGVKDARKALKLLNDGRFKK